ncbi:MAG: hypothetical protein ONB44_21485 [candidate division KSB1 bacterium]|nr:hypothetical protein [candidate division KSB1 bacterium]MDZ7312765.1 hypothetical protein [candidate division KSB1 bacterium]
MIKFIKFILLSWAFLSMLSCAKQPTDSENEERPVRAELRQIPGCSGHGLTKAAFADSCFSYKFTQDLVVDFCVSANCCPDSNRFQFAYEVRHDTIAVAVADTAANLCRCICDYVIHAEFSDLPRDRYMFLCYYQNKLRYNEIVKRSLP